LASISLSLSFDCPDNWCGWRHGSTDSGGLGGAEAGLTAGFVAYGLTSNRALAVTLLYRLLTYWLALVIGALAFSVARRLRYL